MPYLLYQVDAFTGQLFSGNPAAVVPMESWLPDATLQSIAAENNLSETAFLVPRDQDFHLRWFTPLKEVNLCGHATLAAAHILFEHQDYREQTIHFHCRSGTLTVARKDDGYSMLFPDDNPRSLDSVPGDLIEGLDVKPTDVLRGRDDYLVILETQEQVEALQPDLRRLSRLDGRGVIVSAPGRETDFASRCFYPIYGVDEDPVTGSAHTTLAAYWAPKLKKDTMTALQCSKRGGRLTCRIFKDKVELTGQAVTYLEGKILM